MVLLLCVFIHDVQLHLVLGMCLLVACVYSLLLCFVAGVLGFRVSDICHEMLLLHGWKESRGIWSREKSQVMFYSGREQSA